MGGLVFDFDAPRRLPAEYLRKLQELQDRVPAFPTDEALRRVEASLGLRNFTDVFTLLVDEPVAAARPPAKTVTKKKNVTFAAPPPPAQIYVRKRDAFAVFCVAVIAAVAGHYFGTLANAPPDVAAIAEYVQEAPLFETTADLLGDALARARLATSVLRECLE